MGGAGKVPGLADFAPSPFVFRKAEDYGLEPGQFGPWGGWWVGRNEANQRDALAQAGQWLSSDQMAKERAFPVQDWMTFKNSGPAGESFDSAVTTGRQGGEPVLRFDVGDYKPDQGLDLSWGVQHKGRGGGYVTGFNQAPDSRERLDAFRKYLDQIGLNEKPLPGSAPQGEAGAMSTAPGGRPAGNITGFDAPTFGSFMSLFGGLPGVGPAMSVARAGLNYAGSKGLAPSDLRVNDAEGGSYPALSASRANTGMAGSLAGLIGSFLGVSVPNINGSVRSVASPVGLPGLQSLSSKDLADIANMPPDMFSNLVNEALQIVESQMAAQSGGASEGNPYGNPNYAGHSNFGPSIDGAAPGDTGGM